MPEINIAARTKRNSQDQLCLYLRISSGDCYRLVSLNCIINDSEWNEFRHSLKMPSKKDRRYRQLVSIKKDITFQRFWLDTIIQKLNRKKGVPSPEKIASEFIRIRDDYRLVVTYLRNQARRLECLGRIRSSEALMAALRSFMAFLDGENPTFKDLTDDMMQRYEAWLLRSQGVVRNTSSFYLRLLRTYYRKAVQEELCQDVHPFRSVYTGVDKTVKRAVSLECIKRINSLDLSSCGELDYARDMFLMSFLLRGMSFVDMAYLRKKDLQGGIITYRRRKTGQLLEVGWERSMQAVVDKYDTSKTQYLLPIICHEDGTERSQYLNAIVKINRSLKKIALLSGIEANLSTYTARHSWASAARDLRVDLPVISRALGHNNQLTTSIYLSDIKSQEVDKANHMILEGLFHRRLSCSSGLTGCSSSSRPWNRLAGSSRRSC